MAVEAVLPSEPAAPAPPVSICPHFHTAVELIGKRWTGAIVFALMERPLRFAGLSQAVEGLSDRVLSERLKELEAEGIVGRAVYAGKPVRVEYSLTEKGAALRGSVAELRAWAERWANGRPRF